MAKNNSKKKSKQEKREKRQQQSEDVSNSIRSVGRGSIVSDILGSYTGTAYDGGAPEQDADDL